MARTAEYPHNWRVVFSRDKGQFSLLKNFILPEIIERRQKDITLRIWSAGCSTGEEPYSIAILVDEMLPQLKGWDILIIGTEINEKAIEKAKQGIYTQWSFRMTDPELRNRYFRRRGDSWEIDEKIRKMVEFRAGNLMENSFSGKASGLYDMDIILCRNVFIYFNSISVAVVLEKFTAALREGGYLITGHGELYGQNMGQLKPRIFPESVVHQKTSSESGVRSSELQKTEKKRTEVEKLRIAKMSKLPSPPSPLPTPNSQLNNCIKIARKYADSGQYDRAEAECRKALDIDKTAVRPYFLLAHISEIKGNAEEAKELFKRVLYLDPAFVPAYLELSALYERENDSERAKKMRATAIELLMKLPTDSAVEPYEGVTTGELLEYVKKQ